MALSLHIENDLRYKEGLQKGLEAGLEKGLQKGLEKGIHERDTQIVMAMFTDGFGIDVINRITKLSFKEIEQIIRESTAKPNKE